MGIFRYFARPWKEVTMAELKDIIEFLPGTDCRQCGLTCAEFAASPAGPGAGPGRLPDPARTRLCRVHRGPARAAGAPGRPRPRACRSTGKNATAAASAWPCANITWATAPRPGWARGPGPPGPDRFPRGQRHRGGGPPGPLHPDGSGRGEMQQVRGPLPHGSHHVMVRGAGAMTAWTAPASGRLR